jgi:hypothetical protein
MEATSGFPACLRKEEKSRAYVAFALPDLSVGDPEDSDLESLHVCRRAWSEVCVRTHVPVMP